MEEKTERLDKFLGNLGICSRRNVKKLLKDEIVSVNGERVKESGTRIQPSRDEIKINGRKIKPAELLYFLLNKPKDVISTTADEGGRQNVTDLIPTDERIYPVGRLDKDTTGLLLLTNDGDLTHKLTHPKFHVYKVYRLTISGKPNKAQLQAFQNGVLLEDGITSPAEVKAVKENSEISILEVTLHEGRNRQIRRMCETVGIELLELQRIKFGPIAIGALKEGNYRMLTKKEIQTLKDIVKKKDHE